MPTDSYSENSTTHATTIRDGTAIKDTDLLLKVARHKEVFFPAAWARYADAKPGTLRIVPPDARLPELEQENRKCRK